jgi:amidophosphoribosyltransferase
LCGVIGILGNIPLRMSRDLLLLLAHRGQDAAGLLWFEGGKAIDGKAIGSPSLISLPDIKSSQILGSTRYPTSGKRVASEKDLNTFVGPFRVDGVALTHNGNITNMASISKARFECDGEFLAVRLATHLKNNSGDLPGAFRELESEVDGSYSIAGFYNGMLFAYRDSHGFKPLVFGRSSDKSIVASESTVLDRAEVPLERDIYPG